MDKKRGEGVVLGSMEAKRRKSYQFAAGIILLAMLGLVVGLGNTVSFERMMTQVVERYVAENNHQVAGQISSRMKAGREFVIDFADTLSRMPGRLLTRDLIHRKAAAMGLNSLEVLSKDGSSFPEEECPAYLEAWAKETPVLWETPEVSYVADQSIVFSAPVPLTGGADRVVFGIQDYADIRSLVLRADYQNQGCSVLMDVSTGERLISDERAVFPMDDQMLKEFLEQWKKDGAKDAVYQKLLPSQESVLVSVCAVKDTDWAQMAIIPSDFLLMQIRQHMTVYAAIIVFILILFMFLIWHLVQENRRWETVSVTEPLTGGWSREGFIQNGKTAVEGGNACSWAVVYLNIMGFRCINESWGEEDGNRTLQFVYKMFVEGTNRQELVSRSSMDHFFLLLNEAEDEVIRRRVHDMIDHINQHIRQKFKDYSITFAIGVCRMDMAGCISTAMSKAIHASKLGGPGNVCHFYDETIAKLLDREERLNDLFEASLRNHDFQIYLQPKVSPSGNRPCEAEALVRWVHPQEGMIYPSEFIPLFEKNGKICKLDLYMFEEVCRLEDRWIREKKTVSRISVNISRFHLREAGSDIWKKYKKILDQYHIPEGIIEMELTETMFLEENQVPFVKAILDGFRSCGLQVALDDFGFAYSSLSMLKEFAVDALKMDRSFFVNENDKSKKIVVSIIQMAHNLELDVVAEGIEDQEQVEMLKNMGCDLIQGYVYSRPLPVGEFEIWRQENRGC